MTSLTSPPIPLVVTTHTLCAECSYDLHGQAQDGACPECGYSVDESLRAAGLWSAERVRRLRRICLVLAWVSPPWLLFAVGLWRSMGTPGPRVLMAIALTVHLILVIWAGIGGMFVASTQPPRRRIAMVVAMSALICALALPPILVMARQLSASNVPIEFLVSAAQAGRVLVFACGAWWVASALRAFRPMWRSAFAISCVAVGALVVGWIVAGAFYVLTSFGVPMGIAEPVGLVALAGDAFVTALMSAVAIGLRRSLGRNPGREGYAGGE